MLVGAPSRNPSLQGNEVDNQKHYDSVVAGLERFQNDPLRRTARNQIQLFELWLQFAERGDGSCGGQAVSEL